MDFIAPHLFAHAPQPTGTLVVVGAGCSDPVATRQRSAAQRVILVEGDADRAAELTALATGDPSIEVCAQVLAPTPGRQTWHRHTLESLDGLSDLSALVDVYPRLRLRERIDVDALPLQDLLALHGVQREPGRHQILVLNIVLDAAAIRNWLTPAVLARFDRVAVQVGLHPALGTAQAHDELAACLAAHGFVARPADPQEDDGLWRFLVHDFDAGAYERQLLREQLGAAHTALIQVRQAADQERTSAEAERRSREAQEARLSASLGETTARLQQVDRELSEARAEAAAARRQVEVERARVSELESKLREADARAVQASQRANEADQRGAAAEAALVARSQALHAMQAERDQMAAERDRRAGELTRLQDAARDAAASQARDQAASARQAEELADTRRRMALLQDELVRAEAQLDLVKEMLLSEAAL